MLGSPCSPCCNPCNAYTPWPEIPFYVGWPNLQPSWTPAFTTPCSFSSPGPTLSLPDPYVLGPNNPSIAGVASLIGFSGGAYQFLYTQTIDSGVGQIQCDQLAYAAWANRNGYVNLQNPLFPPVVVAVKVLSTVRIELYPFGISSSSPPATDFTDESGLTYCGLLYYAVSHSVIARWDHGLLSTHICNTAPRGSTPRVSSIAPLWAAGPYGTSGGVDRTQYMVWRYNDTPTGNQKVIAAIDWNGKSPFSDSQYQLTQGGVPRDGGQLLL